MNIFFFMHYIVTNFTGHLGVYSSSFFLLLKALKVLFCPKYLKKKKKGGGRDDTLFHFHLSRGNVNIQEKINMDQWWQEMC